MKINYNMILKINELYSQYGTYARTSRELGISPNTVKKYVVPNYTKIVDKKFDKIEEICYNPLLFKNKNFSSILNLSEEEKEELSILQKGVLL